MVRVVMGFPSEWPRNVFRWRATSEAPLSIVGPGYERADRGQLRRDDRAYRKRSIRREPAVPSRACDLPRYGAVVPWRETRLRGRRTAEAGNLRRPSARRG